MERRSEKGSRYRALLKRAIFMVPLMLLVFSSVYGVTVTNAPTTSISSTKNVSTTEIIQPTEVPNQEQIGALTIFFILLLLLISILLVYGLIKAKFHYLPESIACVLLGAIVGLLLQVLPIGDWKAEEALHPTIFFLVLLPPIIFESGYSLHKGNFFQNIGSILVFAIIGTAISAVVIGGFVYVLGRAGVVYKLSAIESFAFGSLISAVDPVATLALFQALDVDPIFYMLVFGESVLNDAVSIVMTSSILAFRGPTEASASSILLAFGHFLLMFLGSSVIGVVFGLISALLLKYINLRSVPSLELGTVLIFAYAPYAFAETLQLSGIMAILFCGIVMSHYTHFNLSSASQITVQLAFRTIAFLSETCVFAYIGLAIFSFHHEFKLSLILWSVFLILLGRAFNIFPLSLVVNRCRSVKISFQNQVIMWFSGLRGAIAFALSLHLPFESETRAVLITTTLIIVLVTIVILGGSTLPLLKILRSHYADKLVMSKTEDQGTTIDAEDLEQTERLSGGIFFELDQKFVIPFFRRQFTQKEVEDSHIEMQKMTSQWYNGVTQVPSSDEESLQTKETVGGSDDIQSDAL
ncbi:sodium/hydrogen exchanger 8-like [Corticium candelabrum]|uniref:sodium/hydrogen exchanger 8-like n=1 Tax=Corticium candelabrum TaxID=121492 RepID=UPI002E264D65|nr:sodium/hydrogen exchanger 8-like [Corticium candelabrum]